MTSVSIDRYRDLGLLAARIGIGFGFVYYHGYGKLIGGPERWEGLGETMEIFGIAFWPTFWGFMLTMAETVAAILIALGFLFRPACLLLAIGMGVAWTSHVVNDFGNPGHAFKNFFFTAGLALIGPGRYSIDDWLQRRKAGSHSEPVSPSATKETS